MELWGSFDRSAEPLSGLFFMLKDLIAPVRCNLHSLHLQHLSVEERAQGEDLDLWGAQRIGLSEVRSYGEQKGEPEDRVYCHLHHLWCTKPLLGSAIKPQANPKCPPNNRLIQFKMDLYSCYETLDFVTMISSIKIKRASNTDSHLSHGFLGCVTPAEFSYTTTMTPL